MDFKIDDKVAYPGHGVGVILKETNPFVVKIIETNMKILIPKDRISDLGLRPIITKEIALKLIDYIKKDYTIAYGYRTWNMRYRENMEKIKSGSIFDAADVLKDLQQRKQEQQLSFGERKMLDIVKNLIFEELTLALDKDMSLLNLIQELRGNI